MAGKLAAGISQEERRDRDNLFGTLRELRAGAQSLRGKAVSLGQLAASISDAASRAKQLAETLAQQAGPLDQDCKTVAAKNATIAEILDRRPNLKSSYGDVTTAIYLNWTQAAAEMNGVLQGSYDNVAERMSKVTDGLDKVIYDCGLITIPARVQGQLNLLPIGGVLTFAQSYSDELPSADDRRRLVQYMSGYPGFLEGLIDVESERIYHASSKPWRRMLSLVVTAALALAGFALIYGACWLGDTRQAGAEWPFTLNDLPAYCSSYAVLVAGALVHVLINLLKQDRSASQTNQVLSDWIMRIHVKETSYWLTVAALWVCLAGLSLAVKGPADWKSSFFVGYSWDSFIDLFLRRFDDAATASQSSVENLIGAGTGAGTTKAATNG